jgi:hypothetical protein
LIGRFRKFTHPGGVSGRTGASGGSYLSVNPYADIALMAPYSVNSQIRKTAEVLQAETRISRIDAN